MTACIGEPISRLRLESFALGAPDPMVALPPLDLPAALPRPARRRRWLAPVFAAAAAAAVLVVVLRRPTPRDPEVASEPSATVGVKGVGEVTLELVRERGGEVSYDARRYAPGDRWKVVVSCPPSAFAWIDVSVADGVTIEHPLATA
jgi:hypothetical protein